MEPLTPDYVQKALDTFGLGLAIRFFENSTATSQLAADEIGCQLGQIAKSICFMVDNRSVVVIASGDQRVDDRKVAALLGITRKQIKFATPEQCIEHIGYAPSGVPPLAHRTAPLAVFLDDSLKRYTQIYPAGGASNAIFCVPLEHLTTITNGTFADIRREA